MSKIQDVRCVSLFNQSNDKSTGIPTKKKIHSLSKPVLAKSGESTLMWDYLRSDMLWLRGRDCRSLHRLAVTNG